MDRDRIQSTLPPCVSTIQRYLQRISDTSNEIFLSAASASEITIKHSMGRLPLPAPVSTYVVRSRERHGIAALPVSEEEALYLPRLPKLHRDPFDIVLICQAIVNGFALLTPDPLVTQYPIRTIW
jgi:PIN domain nuclease of toxin-antitoxin system